MDPMLRNTGLWPFCNNEIVLLSLNSVLMLRHKNHVGSINSQSELEIDSTTEGTVPS